LNPPNQALKMMAQKNTDAKASERRKFHNNHATETAEATEIRVTADFTTEGGLFHQFALDIGIFLLFRMTASPAASRLNKTIALHAYVLLSSEPAAVQINSAAANRHSDANSLTLGDKKYMQDLVQLLSV
jgi:hypothetical protein